MRNYGLCLGLILVLVLTFAEEMPPGMTKPPNMPMPPNLPMPPNMNNMPNFPDIGCFLTLGEKFKQCFLNESLQLPIPEEESDPQGMPEDTSDPDPGYLCTILDKLKRAHECRVKEMKKCSPAEGEFPELGKVSAGIDVLCNQIDNFDVGCFNKYNPKVQECVKEVQGKLKAEGKLKNDDEGKCISADVKYDCFTSALSKCGMNTKQIYLEQLDEYKVPLQCESMRPGRAGRPTYFSYQSAWEDI